MAGEADFVRFTQQGYDALTALSMAGYTRYDANVYETPPGDYGTMKTSVDPTATYSLHPLALKSDMPDSFVPDEQMIPYIDPSESMLESLPLAGDLTGAASDMTFEGEMKIAPAFSGGGTPSATTTSPVFGAVATGGPSSISPWLLVAVIVVAFLLFRED